MISERPNIPSTGQYNMTKTAQILGISRRTLLDASKRGSKYGGIDYSVSRKNGRKIFRGNEILRYWSQ